MNVRYRVELSQDERDELTALLSAGTHAARKLKRAQILLAADAGASDEDIAISIAVGGSTVYRTKRRFVEDNLEAALSEEPRPGAERKLTGKEEALLVATACSNPPEGRARWTLELLAGAMVKLTEHEDLSRETVRRRLAENHLKPWRKDMWCVPQVDGAYVARMEDVLDLYAEAPDPQRPVVCFDESPTQLIGEARQPIPAASRQLERYDCEYRRNGSRTRPGQPQPRRASSNATTASIGATAQSTSSSSSTRTVPGARSRSPTIARQPTSPNACASLPMSIIPRPSRSGSSSITSRPIPPARSTRPFRRRKPDGCCAGWSSTTRPNTPAGSTWSRSRSACCAASASTAASASAKRSSPKSPPGSTSATLPAPASNGCSPPNAPAPNSPVLTPTPPTSHNLCAEVLVVFLLLSRARLCPPPGALTFRLNHQPSLSGLMAPSFPAI